MNVLNFSKYERTFSINWQILGILRIWMSQPKILNCLLEMSVPDVLVTLRGKFSPIFHSHIETQIRKFLVGWNRGWIQFLFLISSF